MLIVVVAIALVTWVLLCRGRDGVPKSVGLAPIEGPCGSVGAVALALMPSGGCVAVVLWAVEAYATDDKGFLFNTL